MRHRSHREHEQRAASARGSGTQSGDSARRRNPISLVMDAAASRGVPLRTIVAAVMVVAATCILAILAYRIRVILLLILAGSFVAAMLEPIVLGVQRWIPRRGLAVTVVVAWSVLVFAGLAVAFGVPLATGVGRFAHGLPSYIHQAEHGRGSLGHLLTRFHIQVWVRHNIPRLKGLGRKLATPALRLGRGAASVIFDLLTVLALTFLTLLEGPKLRAGLLSLMEPSTAERWARVIREMGRAVSGYMLGNLLTSLIAGLVVFVDLLVLGVPYPFLWGLWVALVDFLPMIGGALAGIPTVLFAAVHSLAAGIITLVVFVVYTQIENHVLNPVVMSRTVRISPLVVLLAVLIGGSIGDWLGGTFGAFVGALLAIPTAASLQIAVKEIWLAMPADSIEPTEAQRETSSGA